MTTLAINKGEQFASFDVDAFEVPGGRDELWRFTPLRRLRGLHDGSAPRTAEAAIAVSEQPGVTVEKVQRGDARLGTRAAIGAAAGLSSKEAILSQQVRGRRRAHGVLREADGKARQRHEHVLD